MTHVSDKVTVLIAIDGSPQATYAFEYYIANLYKSNTELILLSVAEANMYQHCDSLDVVAARKTWDQLQKKDADKIKDLEDHYIGILNNLKIDGHFEWVIATKPGEVICKRALAANCNLIVIGSRGLGQIRTMIGSVSEFVLHHAHCPVMICRQEGAGIINVCGPI